ncbi:cytochrome P450 [Amylostereum chailletii]|nr:cytochrome P450 [Amylostereum chailletii]
MLTFILGFSGAVVVYCFYRHFRSLKFVNGIPGLRPLVTPLSPFGAILPNNPLNPGNKWSWTSRRTAYFNYTHDIISIVPILPSDPCYYTCSFDVMKQIFGNDSRLHTVKPYDLTLARLFGDSLPSSSGDIWRRHRRVVAPAFTSQIYDSAWQVAKDGYGQMVKGEGWGDEKEVLLKHVHPLMLRLTLMVISKAGFGFPASWVSNGDKDHQFPEALRIVSETLIPRMVLPSSAYKLPVKSLQNMERSWSTVSSYIAAAMKTTKTRQAEDADPDASSVDMLNRLVASALSIDKFSLSDKEVVANMFSLLFAGHETTASGLMATLGYLSIYKNEQQKAFEEIDKVYTASSPDAPIDFAELPHTLHCFLEAQRLCPSALMLPREMTEDVPVTVTHPQPTTVVLKKGSVVIVDLVGMMRNPHAYDDPEVFRPSRWENVSEHDLGMFGYGPRACIGRKFAQTEALAILSSFIHEWTLEPVLGDGETLRQYEDRVLGDASLVGTAFAYTAVPLKLSKRQM